MTTLPRDMAEAIASVDPSALASDALFAVAVALGPLGAVVVHAGSVWLRPRGRSLTMRVTWAPRVRAWVLEEVA